MILHVVRKVWRKLPPGLRLRLSGPAQRVAESLSASAPAISRAQDGCISVIGYHHVASGLGAAARSELDLLRRLGFAAEARDITDAIAPDRDMLPDGSDLPAHALAAGDESGLAILHTNPPEMVAALMAAHVHPRKYRVGYWVYELERAPATWSPALRLVNEVWAPSAFAAAAIRAIGARNVHVMPHPVNAPRRTGTMRPAFGLEPGDFVALYSYDVCSSHARKYPEAAIAAFRRGLAGVATARLLLKIVNPDKLSEWDRASLKHAIEDDPRIQIVTRLLSQGEMDNLVHDADVIVSLHRAEGYGLLLAGAMIAGRAVVATGWSGNLDFMSEATTRLVPFKLVEVEDRSGCYSGGRWAEPDIDAAAAHLAWCHNFPSERDELGRRAAVEAARFFGPQLDRTRCDRLEAIGLTRSTERRAT